LEEVGEFDAQSIALSHCTKRYKLDAGSPTLARLAAPLTTAVMKISSVDKTKKLVAMATCLEVSKNDFQIECLQP